MAGDRRVAILCSGFYCAAFGRHTLGRCITIAAASLAFGVVSAQGTKQPTAALASPTIRMERWYSYFESLAARPRSADPMQQAIDANNQDPFASPTAPLPSISEKYVAGVMPTDLGDLVRSRLIAIRSQEPGDVATQITGWSVITTNCSGAAPYLLTSLNVNSKRLCVAPLLLSSIFLSTSSYDMTRLTAWLRSYGVDPATFTGIYDPKLAQRGLTAQDWQAVVASYGSSFKNVIAAVDLVLAERIHCGILNQSGNSCASAAVAIVKKVDPGASAVGLLSSLSAANAHYDPGSWGYIAAGDGGATAQGIASRAASPF